VAKLAIPFTLFDHRSGAIVPNPLFPLIAIIDDPSTLRDTAYVPETLPEVVERYVKA
jgi:hypothetical protein